MDFVFIDASHKYADVKDDINHWLPKVRENGMLAGDHVVSVALQGRVPVKVKGPVQKGDMMVSCPNGYARAEQSPIIGSVIGKAIENFDGIDGIIEIAVGRL